MGIRYILKTFIKPVKTIPNVDSASVKLQPHQMNLYQTRD